MLLLDAITGTSQILAYLASDQGRPQSRMRGRSERAPYKFFGHGNSCIVFSIREKVGMLNFRENELLAALPLDSFARLLPSLEYVALPPKEMLYDFNDALTHIYFPNRNAVVSLLCTSNEHPVWKLYSVAMRGLSASLVS